MLGNNCLCDDWYCNNFNGVLYSYNNCVNYFMQIKNILLDIFIFLIMLTANSFLNKYGIIKIYFLIVVLLVKALNKYSLKCTETKHVFQNRRAIRLFVTPCNVKHALIHTHTNTHTHAWGIVFEMGEVLIPLRTMILFEEATKTLSMF